MKELNLPLKLIRLIEISITEKFVKIMVGSAETEPMLIKLVKTGILNITDSI